MAGTNIHKEIEELRKKANFDSFVKFDEEKIRYELLDPLFLEGIAKVLTYGANKYCDHNWIKCTSAMRYFGALMRHMWAWANGEDNDKETGISHLAHAGCCLMFMYGLLRRNKSTDDRVLVDKELIEINIIQPNKPKKKNGKSNNRKK